MIEVQKKRGNFNRWHMPVTNLRKHVFRKKKGSLKVAKQVGIAIISSSDDVARGIKNLVVQAVGSEFPCTHFGNTPDIDPKDRIRGMREVIEAIWTESGVAVFVDLGGTEMAAETAVKAMPDPIRKKVRICNAPILEGAITAALIASNGRSLEDVCSMAERYALASSS